MPFHQSINQWTFLKEKNYIVNIWAWKVKLTLYHRSRSHDELSSWALTLSIRPFIHSNQNYEKHTHTYISLLQNVCQAKAESPRVYPSTHTSRPGAGPGLATRRSLAALQFTSRCCSINVSRRVITHAYRRDTWRAAPRLLCLVEDGRGRPEEPPPPPSLFLQRTAEDDIVAYVSSTIYAGFRVQLS